MTSRRFLAIVFRLSLVAGIGFGLFDAYRTLSDWDSERSASIQSQIRMECAAKISDDWLAQNANEYGNIDVSPICGPGSNGKTFITNAQEIAETRRGENFYAQLRWQKPYDLTKASIAAAAAFIAVNLIGFAMLGLFLLGKWVAYGVRQ